MGEYTEFKTYLVKVVGEVVVKADSSSDALTKATEYFVTTGKGLNWSTVEQTVIQPVVV